ncbi:response regulator [Pseudolysobacter antarcticus]|uniref:Response regulator n=1 Tax=Pseudolysobacter antarcticus TaxID=2511995 RepID=A0A411HJ58_9GAMM|nr:response regulator [Pseudolysobacter antarcticus]QBB70562.1 response regulator [Pseudolysobacter antarcticus]
MSRILIADDNPLSLQFLLEAMTQLGIDADGADDGAAALTQANRQRYDLLLLDNRMPKLSGPDVLKHLRTIGISTPAIATSAEVTPALRADLLATGFAQVLEKPLSLATLENALRPYFAMTLIKPISPETSHIPTTDITKFGPLLDDAAALPGVGGDRIILHALRQLLVDELAAIPDEFARLDKSRDHAALRERLHRLQASAGFCGASVLAAACTKLRRLIDAPGNSTESHIEELRQTAAATLVALRDLSR